MAAWTGGDGELDAGVAEGEGGEGFGEEGADGVLEAGAGDGIRGRGGATDFMPLLLPAQSQ